MLSSFVQTTDAHAHMNIYQTNGEHRNNPYIGGVSFWDEIIFGPRLC